MTRWLIAVTACMAAGQAATGQQRLTYVDLVGRLTDLEHLSVLPAAGEKCQQWASWDRRSQYDDAAGKYVAWSANGDGTGIIRKEGDVEVFAEMEGPGVIWRIWSARTDKGHVKIYLDGAETPAVDLPFVSYFDRTTKPFVYESLCYMAARGQNCYVPIPFRKSCKVVAEKGWGRYYHFTWTKYPPGTELPTFRLPLSDEETAALAKADEYFRTGFGTDPATAREGARTLKGSVTVEPGKSAIVADLAGPRAITALRGKMNADDPNDERAALREVCLQITWDDDTAPAVWSPAGDFFGTAPGVNDYKSFPMGITEEDGAYSLWYMPFAKRCKAEMVNDGKEARTVKYEITHAPLSRPAEQLGRFHAKWHRDALLPEDAERRAIDWTLLKTAGRGRFVGVMLHVWNPRGGWWGEGDEKFYVDAEKFPSTFGTGSEDYFGYAWCTPEIFHRAFHNQTIVSGNRGHVSVNRWHVSDNVPFQTSFEAAIEKYYPNAKPTLYASIAYWYQAPGGADPYEPVPVAERWGYCVEPAVHRVKGAIEGETMRTLEQTAGNARPQDMSIYAGGKWSGLSHLWWTGAKPGDKLTLAVPVKQAGKYDVQAVLTKARDYGVVQLWLDGQKAGEPIDLYDPEVVNTPPISLGTHELSEGAHKLTVEITGANPKALKAYMSGLDYVLLKAAE